MCWIPNRAASTGLSSRARSCASCRLSGPPSTTCADKRRALAPSRPHVQMMHRFDAGRPHRAPHSRSPRRCPPGRRRAARGRVAEQPPGLRRRSSTAMNSDAIGSSRSAPNSAAPSPAMMTATEPAASARRCQNAAAHVQVAVRVPRQHHRAPDVDDETDDTRRRAPRPRRSSCGLPSRRTASITMPTDRRRGASTPLACAASTSARLEPDTCAVRSEDAARAQRRRTRARARARRRSCARHRRRSARLPNSEPADELDDEKAALADERDQQGPSRCVDRWCRYRQSPPDRRLVPNARRGRLRGGTSRRRRRASSPRSAATRAGSPTRRSSPGSTRAPLVRRLVDGETRAATP